MLSTKSNVFTLLKSFIFLVQNQFHSSFKTLRSDNAFELGSSAEATSFFSNQGIIHQISCPHTPQQNEVVERKHKYLLETARSLLFQSKLPLKYWGECVLTATYLINRFPSPLLNHKTPFELFFGISPVYSHLRVFGCLCFAVVPKPYRDKFHSRTVSCMFFGYSMTKKAFKLLNLTKHNVFFSRDVVFHESVFPYSSPSPTCLFPSTARIYVDFSAPSPPVTSAPISASTHVTPRT